MVSQTLTLDYFTLFSYFMYNMFLIWFLTFYDFFPDFAWKSMMMLVLGLFGFIFGLLIMKNVDIQWKPNITTTSFVMKLGLIFFLSAGSFILQMIAIFYGYSSFLSEAQTRIDPTYAVIFYLAAATNEYILFQFCGYRAFKKLWSYTMPNQPILSRILSILLVSLLFGFVYHQVVYGSDVVLMTTAAIGSAIYCIGQDMTSLSLGGFLPHWLQNLRLP